MSETTELSAERIVPELIEFISRELVGARSDLELQAEDDLLGSGLVDSLGVMRLIRNIEESYGLVVPPADVTIDNFMTVAMIAAYLERLRSEDEGSSRP